jgi:hypothetical protein
VDEERIIVGNKKWGANSTNVNSEISEGGG